MSGEKEFIEVNQVLGNEPKLGIFTQSQITSSIIVMGMAFGITCLLDLEMSDFFWLSIWLVGSWLLLIGNKPYEFTDLFQRPPGTDWCNGHLKYVSPSDPRYKLVRNLAPIKVSSQGGGKLKYMAFQDYLHLNYIFTIETGKETIGGYLLKQGKKYQIVWAFDSLGFHHLFDENQASIKAGAIERGMKEIPRGEKLRIAWSKQAEVGSRLSMLERLIDQCKSSVIRTLLKNEKGQIKELTASGIRQKIEKKIFCTYTTTEDLEIKRGDPLGNLLRIGNKFVSECINYITGNEVLITQGFYKKLLLTGYERSYLPWVTMLSQRIGWKVKPMNSASCLEYIYHKFNAANLPVPELAQEWVLDLKFGRIELSEIITNSDDLRTVLIQGNNGEDATPQHHGSTDTVYLPGRRQEAAILTLDDLPKGWYGVLSQLNWMWKFLSDPQTVDTEAIVEITTASDFLIKHDLRKISRSALRREKQSLKKGRGRDAEATIDSERAFEAQKQMYIGRKCLHTATVFVVQRPNAEELAAACRHLVKSLDLGKLTREKRIAWKIWLECLPINISSLLQQSSWLADRRLVFDNVTVAGIIPNLVPRDLDREGIEFITTGGKPIYFDLLSDLVKRCLIVGETGSGKTGIAYRFLIEALAKNIPTVGIDFNFGSRNTFKYALSLLGDKAAYINLSETASNLLEPPDLRGFNPEAREERFKPWLEQTRATINGIVTWGENNSTLVNRAEALIMQSLKIFFEDDDINERYGEALEGGWKSSNWQKMPVLKDWLKFVSKEHLGLYNYTQTDIAAINLIHAQINAFLTTPVGELIGRVSSVPSDPLVKFFSFSSKGNKKEEYVLSNVALSACLRNTLSNPKSLLLADEIDSLLKKQGFGEAIAALCSLGRGTGTAVVLITHGIECLDNNGIGSEILNSITHRFIGKITRDCANSIVQKWGINESFIRPNTDKEYGNFKQLYSSWLILENQYCWQAKCYLSPMILGSIANGTMEILERNKFRANHPNTLKGELLALKEFSISKYKQGNIDSQKAEEKQPCHQEILVKNGSLR